MDKTQRNNYGWWNVEDGRMKPKADLMRKLRKERVDKGLVELRLWLTPEQKERVLKYVARFKRDA